MLLIFYCITIQSPFVKEKEKGSFKYDKQINKHIHQDLGYMKKVSATSSSFDRILLSIYTFLQKI